LSITKAINDIKSWDVTIIQKNEEKLVNSYFLKTLKVKDSVNNEWVRNIKPSQKDTVPYLGNTKTAKDGTEVVIIKPLGIDALVLHKLQDSNSIGKHKVQNSNSISNLEISLAECGEITQNPWFDESSTSSWSQTESIPQDVFGNNCVGFYYWKYDEPVHEDRKDCMGGYNEVKIILYAQGKWQHRVELTGSVLPDAWFLRLSKEQRRKIEYAAKNDIDKLRVCVDDRLGCYAYLSDDCGLDEKHMKNIMAFFNNPDSQNDKRPMQWVHWGETRVIPYEAIGNLEVSKCYEEEQPFEPEWWMSLSRKKQKEIRHKISKQITLTEREDGLNKRQIRDVTSYFKKQLAYSDAPFEEKWWRETGDRKKEVLVSKVVKICQETTTTSKTGYQDDNARLQSEKEAYAKLEDLRLALPKQYGENYVISQEHINDLYKYCNKKVRHMTIKKWYYMEKQLHDIEDWCNWQEDEKKLVVRKRFNELNDMGPFPHQEFTTLREWAVFTFGAKIINRGEDEEEEGSSIGFLILMLVADSEWELRCVASLFEFARLLTPEGLAKVDDSFSKFEMELAKEEKEKGGPANGIKRGSSLLHRSHRAFFKRVSSVKYLQNELPR